MATRSSNLIRRMLVALLVANLTLTTAWAQRPVCCRDSATTCTCCQRCDDANRPSPPVRSCCARRAAEAASSQLHETVGRRCCCHLQQPAKSPVATLPDSLLQGRQLILTWASLASTVTADEPVLLVSRCSEQWPARHAGDGKTLCVLLCCWQV